MGLRRTVQVAALVLFLLLLGGAIWPAVPASGLLLPLDFFLRLDPGLAAVTALSGRIALAAFVPALVVVLLAPVVGRGFCGWICPMGTTLDGTDKLIGSPGDERPPPVRLRRLKYLVLAFLLGAALLGVSFVFAASPLSLITRLYGLLIYPVLALVADGVLGLVRPLGEVLGINALVFAQVETPRFATQVFIFVFFAAVFWAARVTPRLWCRYLCPSGALLALVSWNPVFRRRVASDCTGCGTCLDSCPMGAIDAEDSSITRHHECILCRTCQEACPQRAGP